MKSICESYKVTRQGFHKYLCLQARRQKQEQKILAVVHSIRHRHPEMGVRKLCYRLNRLDAFRDDKIGRDRLFALLRRNRLLVRVKRRRIVTTNSHHAWRRFSNLLRAADINSPKQAYVADITYLRLQQGFCYLFLLTDYYSRRIAGYYLSPDLGAKSAIKVLRQAAKDIPGSSRPIHHRAQGIQYSCPSFTQKAAKLGFMQSMTEHDHVYENAMAERVNGILKQEYHLDSTMPSLSIARRMLKQAVNLYNQERPHLALDFQSPDEVYYKKTGA